MEYSVIIPTYNSEKYLVETINTVLRQTVRPKEIIICDNGSTDKTINMAESLGKPVIFTTETEKGPGPARNKAVSLATTELIAFIDSDDLWHPKKMELQLPLMNECDLSYSYTRFIYPSKTLSYPQKPIDHSNISHLYKDNYIVTSSVVMKKDVFNELGGFDSSIKVTEDWDLWLRVLKNNMIKCCPFELLDKREHDNNISRDNLLMYKGISQTLDKNNHLVSPGLAFKIRMKYLKQYFVTALKANQFRKALAMVFN